MICPVEIELLVTKINSIVVIIMTIIIYGCIFPTIVLGMWVPKNMGKQLFLKSSQYYQEGEVA